MDALWSATEHFLNSVAILTLGLTLDFVAAPPLGHPVPICSLATADGFTALAAAYVVLSVSHRAAITPWGSGAVPMTAQTLALCVIGLLCAPRVALGAVAIYVSVGVAAAWLPSTSGRRRLEGYGPRITGAAAGFVVGFLPATALVAKSSAGRARPLPFQLGLAASVAAHCVILACGAAGLAARKRLGARAVLDAAVRPYLPGLLVKSALAAGLAAGAAPGRAWEAMCGGEEA